MSARDDGLELVANLSQAFDFLVAQAVFAQGLFEFGLDAFEFQLDGVQRGLGVIAEEGGLGLGRDLA